MNVEVIENPSSLPIRLGRVWFHWRSFSPVPLFLLFLFLPPNFTLGPLQNFLIVTFILAAEGLRIWAVSFAGSRTRTRGDTVIELVHAGPYRYVRNPLYIANILMYTGAGVLFGFSYLSVFVFLYSCFQYTFIVRFEESVLERDIGAPYLNYKAQVPRWFPSFTPQIESSRHAFNLKQGLRSERSTFYSMLAMTTLYVLKTYIL